MIAVPSAASQVLATSELLEPILLYAALPSPLPKNREASKKWGSEARLADYFGFSQPPQDLIDCKTNSQGIRFILTSALRVNKFWNSVINDSKAIQEALFFRWSSTVYPKNKPTFNPLLVSTFTWGYFHQALPLTKERDGEIRSSIIYAKASWRRMFPIVPPVKELKAHKEKLTGYWDYDCDGKIHLKDIGENDGLRMGLLFDIVEESTEPVDTSNFSVTWPASVEMATQPGEVRKHYKKYSLSSLRVSGFAEPIVSLFKGQADAIAVDSVHILLSEVDPRRPPSCSVIPSYPKLESKGKQWNLRCIRWGEICTSK